MTSRYRIEVRANEPLDEPEVADVCGLAAQILAEQLYNRGIPTFTIEVVEIVTGRSERVLQSWARACGGELAPPMEGMI
jgi:hypothetical protein